MGRIIYVLSQVVSLAVDKMLYMINLVQKKFYKERKGSIDTGKIIHIVFKDMNNTSCMIYNDNIIQVFLFKCESFSGQPLIILLFVRTIIFLITHTLINLDHTNKSFLF